MSQISDCPIWSVSEATESISALSEINSLRAGGKYKIDVETFDLLSEISNETRARLTDWLVEQRRLGIEIPEITQKQVERARTASAPSVIDKAERLLKHLEQNSDFPGVQINLQCDNQTMYHPYLLAIIGSTNPGEHGNYGSSHKPGQENWRSELNLYFNYLEKKGWISRPSNDELMHITVEFEGYAHLETLQTKTDSKQAFVAMWFDDSMENVYYNGIKPAIKDAGYKPERIKDNQFNNEINDKIISEIRRSRFLVADFTHGREGQRGGVYYEAGLAKGLGLEVIYTCKENLRDKIHFDTQQFNHIFWNFPEDLKGKLKNRIGNTIGDGPLNIQNS